MKTLLLLITTLFFNNAIACLDMEFFNLKCVQNDRDGIENYDMLSLKLTKNSITNTFIEDGAIITDHISLPSYSKEYKMKYYCEGVNLIVEESFITASDRSVTVFNANGFEMTGSEKIRQCLDTESHEECVAKNRPIKEFKYKVNCTAAN